MSSLDPATASSGARAVIHDAGEGRDPLPAIFTPGGVEAMFVDSAEPADAQRLPGDETVQPGAMTPHEKRHRVEMVGPPLGG